MSNKNKNKEGIVYSTNPAYNFSSGEKEDATLPPAQQILYLRREMRNGKPVCVVKEFVGKGDDLKELEKKLKQLCGVGGTCKDGDIIIQGDNKAKIEAYLNKAGYKTKG